MKSLLERVCDLYVLANIEADRAWFQEHGRMSSTRAKAVTRTLNRLCAELRPHAGALVDAFGIPDAVLSAPIGLDGAYEGGALGAGSNAAGTRSNSVPSRSSL
jgi:acyl-CoA oxidase